VADDSTLALTVATPLGLQLDLSVESVQLPGVAGEFGVLPGHIELLAALKPGVVRYRLDGRTYLAAIGTGYTEADHTHVRVLSEFFAKAEDIAVEEARIEAATAQERLKTLVLGDPEQVEAQQDLDWALARIEVAQSGGAAH